VSIDPWLRPWRSSNFTWVFLTRAFVIAAITLFATYSAYYFANVLRVQHFAQEAALIGVVSLLGALISAPTLGKLSDRLGRVPFVCLTTSCMALAALVFSLAPPDLIDRGGLVPLLFIGLLFGVGYGGYTSVDWALAIDVLPSLQDAAKDLGIWSISSNLPAAVAPLLGGLLLGIAGARHQTTLGYRGVYALATLFLMLAAGFILMVREDGQA
jgi:MFS family permease